MTEREFKKYAKDLKLICWVCVVMFFCVFWVDQVRCSMLFDKIDALMLEVRELKPRINLLSELQEFSHDRFDYPDIY